MFVSNPVFTKDSKNSNSRALYIWWNFSVSKVSSVTCPFHHVQQLRFPNLFDINTNLYSWMINLWLNVKSAAFHKSIIDFPKQSKSNRWNIKTKRNLYMSVASQTREYICCDMYNNDDILYFWNTIRQQDLHAFLLDW